MPIRKSTFVLVAICLSCNVSNENPSPGRATDIHPHDDASLPSVARDQRSQVPPDGQPDDPPDLQPVDTVSPIDLHPDQQADVQQADVSDPYGTTFGWDYNLTHRCVQSPHPAEQNFYQDGADCPSPQKRWTVAVQSEQTLSASCPGPGDQSFVINGVDSPVSISWQPHTDGLGRSNWSVNLKTNLNSITHPCGANHFTWFVLMDHGAHGGGPFPKPNKVHFSANVHYNDFVPNGSTRAIAAWQGFWDGKARLVEIAFQSANWGDNYPQEPDIVNTIDKPTMQFVHMDGAAMGLSVPRKVTTKLVIPWHEIIADLIQRGYLSGPSGGWQKSVTSALFIGHEVHNLTASKAAVADLWVTNFRVESL